MNKLIKTLKKEITPVKHCADLTSLDRGTGLGVCKMKGRITVETCMECRYRRAA